MVILEAPKGSCMASDTSEKYNIDEPCTRHGDTELILTTENPPNPLSS